MVVRQSCRKRQEEELSCFSSETNRHAVLLRFSRKVRSQNLARARNWTTIGSNTISDTEEWTLREDRGRPKATPLGGRPEDSWSTHYVQGTEWLWSALLEGLGAQPTTLVVWGSRECQHVHTAHLISMGACVLRISTQEGEDPEGQGCCPRLPAPTPDLCGCCRCTAPALSCSRGPGDPNGAHSSEVASPNQPGF